MLGKVNTTTPSSGAGHHHHHHHQHRHCIVAVVSSCSFRLMQRQEHLEDGAHA